MNDRVILLWSGGWDGTFRLLQLCQYNISIQPVYIIDKERASTNDEISAMKSIIQLCTDRFHADIQDIKFYNKEDILEQMADEEISEAFYRLRKKYNIGTQYEWFALLCNNLNIDMESAVVHQYHGKVEDAIIEEGKLGIINDEVLGERYSIISEQSSRDLRHVFGRIILPVINLTKKDEENTARQNGWIDIMQFTWFCHSPIKGEPCGLCGPCDDAMNTGMEWRMPSSAIRRYKYKKYYRAFRKVKKLLK